MPTFSVMLEDVTTSVSAQNSFIWHHDNQRTETIEADDINDAWVKARYQYYTLKVDGPDAQIIDIEPGTLNFKRYEEEKQKKPIPVSSAVAPEPLIPIRAMSPIITTLIQPPEQKQ